jgi:hypothetical protein
MGRFLLAVDAHHLSVDRLRRGGRFDRFLFRSMLDIYRLWRDGSLLASSLRLRAWPAAAPIPPVASALRRFHLGFI